MVFFLRLIVVMSLLNFIVIAVVTITFLIVIIVMMTVFMMTVFMIVRVRIRMVKRVMNGMLVVVNWLNIVLVIESMV